MTRASRVLTVQVLAVAVFALSWRSLDFSIYVLGGRAVGDGDRLYTEQLLGHWFTYTPFAAVVFAPLSCVPLLLARLVWELGSVAAFALSVRTTLRLAGLRVQLRPCVALGLLLEPVWHSLFLGQVNLYLLALVLVDVQLVSHGRRAGVLVGLATAVKLTPAVFVVLLLLAGRTRAAVRAASTFAICTALAWAIAPEASLLYWTRTFHDTRRVGAIYISNQSPFGAAGRILHDSGGVGHWYAVVPPLVAAVGLVVAAAYARRGDWLTAAATTGTTGLLVSPISWTHHWVWVLPALAVLVRDGHRVAAGCVYAVFVVAPPWWTPAHGTPGEYGWHGATTVAANAYLLAGVTFLTFACVRTRAALTSADGRSRSDTSLVGEAEGGELVEPVARAGVGRVGGPAEVVHDSPDGVDGGLHGSLGPARRP
ncbi:alpha-1,2-mannosyltransferase [Motilibacter peucedani]|uniref:Alpha-1,2-mannosyltransferase n=1 Tax=Motilibacter peucedani TaxID=598650 RepID=A0A420XTJ7_9ACTN|nr:alpha-1,2-mannosyltransferase [Motilibacter peucedani]